MNFVIFKFAQNFVAPGTTALPVKQPVSLCDCWNFSCALEAICFISVHPVSSLAQFADSELSLPRPHLNRLSGHTEFGGELAEGEGVHAAFSNICGSDFRKASLIKNVLETPRRFLRVFSMSSFTSS